MASVNEDQVSPLLLASHYGHTKVLGLLLDAKADLNYSAPGWGTALDSATGECAAILLQRGAKKDVPVPPAAPPKASEHFGYGSLEGGASAVEALKSFGKDSSASAAAAFAAARASSAPVSRSETVTVSEASPGPLAMGLNRLSQLVRTVGALCMGAPGLESLRAITGAVASDRATADGTERFLRKAVLGQVKELGQTGLKVSSIGFGCHRLEVSSDHKGALQAALKAGCNLIDVAPNYTDGAAEVAVGEVLAELFAKGALKRDEVVVCTKVGNIVGSALRLDLPKRLQGVAKVRDDVWHCLEPAWIEEEIERSLKRLRLSCVDVLLLHCPEFASKAAGVTMEEVYRRLKKAFQHLELEVQRGRIARYGVTAAFYPLRPMDPEHLLLDEVLKQLPQEHHFQVIQFPLNFAEPYALWAGHTERDAHGVAVDSAKGLEAPALIDFAKQRGVATLTNRPLDGLYREMRGVLRFSSDIPINGEMQGEDVDALEAKLTIQAQGALGDAADPISEELAAKTLKTLSSLKGVDCVLAGMRQERYVAGLVSLHARTPPMSSQVALEAVRRLHDTIAMWFCAATAEADHGTAKDWRLPPKPPAQNS